MLSDDFNKELKLINAEYFLEFNWKLNVYQARMKRRSFVKFAPIEINGSLVALGTMREYSVVFKSLSKMDLNRRTLNEIQKQDWENRHLGAKKIIEKIIRNNDEMDEKQDNQLSEDMRYGLRSDKNQIFETPSVCVTDNPLAV